MRKLEKIISGTTVLFLLIGSLIGCSSTTPTPASTLTPTPIPMVRVTIELDDVQCNGQQSVFWWQYDKFYMLTTFSASNPTPRSAVVTQSQLSNPVTIDNNQDLAIPPGPLIVFDAQLPMDGTIRGGFTAYNGGVADDDIAQFASWTGAIADKVSEHLLNDSVDSENLDLIAGATVLYWGTQAFSALLAPSDNPTELGNQPIEITANGQQVQPGTLSFVQNSGPGHTWNYLIHYTIMRTFTRA